jgi:hypothetical protein
MKTLLTIILALTFTSTALAGGDPYLGKMTLRGVERENPTLYLWEDYEIQTFDKCLYRQSKVRAYIYLWGHNEPLEDSGCKRGQCYLDFGRGRKCEIESFYRVYPPGC